MPCYYGETKLLKIHLASRQNMYGKFSILHLATYDIGGFYFERNLYHCYLGCLRGSVAYARDDSVVPGFRTIRGDSRDA